ncbi:InlB B-repeat-containing protein [Halorussus lipolyticus]|uniref:InlB B-repeat-containing protein n=1 Tax=Halorussus lipolyticus TaxID=3034024 RepID=UPI0023E89632|nr:PKD domain-containing protein [Halorussus sp. DT80]
MDVRTLLIVTLLIISSVAPALGVTQSYQDPDPNISVSAPSEVTVGEQFTIQVDGANFGGRAGKYSTISVSFPGHATDSHVNSIYTDLSFELTREAGDTIYDKYGGEMTADYALAEAGVGGSSGWDAGSDNQLSVTVTPQETGTFVFYTRVTLTDDENPDRKFNAPEYGDTTDQQGFEVARFEVDVRANERTLELGVPSEGEVRASPPYSTYRDGQILDYEVGTDVTLEAQPDSGYKFDHWEGDYPSGDRDEKRITVEMDQNRGLMPVFVEDPTEYLLGLDVKGTEGEVHVDPPYDTVSSYVEKQYEEGTDVTLEADPRDGYKFDHWEGDYPSGDRDDSTITVEMDRAKLLRPVFAEVTPEYGLDVDVPGQKGEVEMSPPYDSFSSYVSKSYEEGTDVTLEATPAEGYKFDYWEGDYPYGEEDSQSITVEMDEAKSLTPVFAEVTPEYGLNVDVPDEGGEVEMSPPYDSFSSYVSKSYEEGTDVTLEATASDDYEFDHWKGDYPYGEEDSRTITVEMDEAKSLTPVFEEDITRYSLDASASSDRGDVEISPSGPTGGEEGTYKEGSEVTLEAIPAEGYVFDHWEGDYPDGERDEQTISVEIDADKSLDPVFAEENEKPIPEIEASSQTPTIGETVEFDAEDSEDPDGRIRSYTWTVNGDDPKRGEEVSYEFPDPGEYSVKLVVEDESGDAVTKRYSVTVRDRPSVSIQRDVTKPKIGQHVPLTAVSDDSDVEFEWDTDGDGEFEESGSKVSPAFEVGGKHRVRVRATDSNDVANTATRIINVQKNANFQLNSNRANVVATEESAIVTFTVANIVEKENLNAKLELELPEEGVSIAGVGGGELASRKSTKFIQVTPDDDETLQVRLQINEPGEYEIRGQAVYYFAGQDDRREQTVGPVTITAREPGATTTDDPDDPDDPDDSDDQWTETTEGDTPGFGIAQAVVAMLVVVGLFRRRAS